MSMAKRSIWQLIATAGLGVAAFATGLDARPPMAATSLKRSNSLDDALRVLANARQSYGRIQDYACTLIKRERIDGELQGDNIIAMRVRTTPFSVYFKWHEPKNLTGQEACYVTGKNDGMMRVKPNGLLAAVGFISLSPNDARAQKTTKRNITVAGIGNLIERIGMAWEAERQIGKAQVRIGEFDYNKRRCIRVETINSGLGGSTVSCSRSLIYFDKENSLPIRIECYDTPKEAGKTGDLLEMYSFINLRLNVGLGDEVFEH